MRIKRFLLLGVLVALAIPTFVVFAKELGSLTISGPGIKGELTLNDPDLMMKLEQSGFFDQAVLSDAPKNLDLDAGYKMTAILNLDGKMTPYIQMVYYATKEGQPGYIHYTSRINGDSMQPVDEWGILSRSADEAFRTMMTASNVSLQSALVADSVKAKVPAASAAEPVTAPVVASPKPDQNIYLALAAGTGILLLIGAGLLIRRRTVTPIR